jgi:hypothetical protein
MIIIGELYQLTFILSIILMVSIIFDFFIKTYGRFKLNKETKFILTKTEKILFWISLGIFLTFLI